ncbi:MAG: hypothetical protein KKE00_09855 [Proteobacteria bacterium]|nr:hypothetical protein [Pseudomonadota bacterium]MBU1570804.1 hypothetical protein [Pseudomonadota bacterium]
MKAKKRSEIIVIILSPIVGFLSYCLPLIATNGNDLISQDMASLSFVSYVFENTNFLPTIFILLFSGVLLGYFAERIWWAIGPLSISVFPIAVMYEIITNPTSHNLWPIEILIILISCMPPIIGSLIGKIVNHWVEKRVKVGARIGDILNELWGQTNFGVTS